VRAALNSISSWEATQSGSVVTFDFDVAEGLAGFWYWRTADATFGSVDCIVDGQENSLHTVQAYKPDVDASTFTSTGDLYVMSFEQIH